jgi:hypothetical protein
VIRKVDSEADFCSILGAKWWWQMTKNEDASTRRRQKLFLDSPSYKEQSHNSSIEGGADLSSSC